MKHLILILISLFLISCATSRKLNKISVGMTKEQAISILGEPVSVASPGPNQEFLNYRFSETDDDALNGRTTPYYVLIENGRVRQYGRHGDFGVTKDPTININTKSDINTTSNRSDNSSQTSTERMQKELKALKELFDEGILTKEEYNREKKEILNKY